MDVTPHELRDCQITDAFRGYNRDEVNELMERAAATIETQAEKIRILTERVSSVTTDATRTRDNEDIIQRTLIMAQRAADEAVADASRQAAEILGDAEARSRALVDAANDEVHRVHDVERTRLEAEIRNLAAHRDALHADVDALEAWEREYRGRVISQLEADLATARAKKAVAPPPPPPPSPMASTIEEQVASEATGEIAMAEPADDAAATEPAAAEPGRAEANVAAPEPEIDLTTTGEPAQAPQPSKESSEVREPIPVAAGAAPAMPARPAEPPAPLAGSATRASQQQAPRASSSPARPTPAPVQDAKLDDDAFFATLRDAVRDDAPLGPSDDRLFETERESSLRDIFKRKR